MESSGVMVTDVTRWTECDGTVTHEFPLFTKSTFTQSWPCEFAGEVDVVIDPEIFAASWECPRCGTTHDVSKEFFE